MSKDNPIRLALAAMAAILPGDHIHHTAPVHKGHDTRAMMDSLDAAQMKRLRKMQRNQKVKP